jgi:hypothetical protein
LAAAVNLEFGDDASFIVYALRLLAEQTPCKVILERLDEYVFVRQMRK